MNRPAIAFACWLLTVGSIPIAGATSSKLDFSDVSKPDFFPILPWDPQHGWKAPFVDRGTNGLQSIAQCNFNMAGFVFASDLRQCQKLGLGAILQPLDSSGSFSSNYWRQWRNLSGDEIDRRVKEMVRLGGSSPALKGYFITDEPGIRDFPALAQAVAAVKKYAPGKMAYINLYPDYATIGAPDMSQLGTSNYTEYLEQFVKIVKPQFISYDNYMVQMSQDLTDVKKATSYYRNLLEVRRVAQKYNLPYLNIVSGNQIRPFTTIPSPANLSFQAYTTLAAGYRGVTWFTYYSRSYRYAPIDVNDKRTLTWAYLQEINRQVATLAPLMSRMKSTGVFFTEPTPVPNLPLLPGSLVQSVDCAIPVMVGEFQHEDGTSYVMVVNLSLERSAKFKLKLKARADNMSVVSAMNGSLSPFDDKEGMWLVAGQGTLLQIK